MIVVQLSKQSSIGGSIALRRRNLNYLMGDKTGVYCQFTKSLSYQAFYPLTPYSSPDQDDYNNHRESIFL